jgi:hypothetical protein
MKKFPIPIPTRSLPEEVKPLVEEAFKIYQRIKKDQLVLLSLKEKIGDTFSDTKESAFFEFDGGKLKLIKNKETGDIITYKINQKTFNQLPASLKRQFFKKKFVKVRFYLNVKNYKKEFMKGRIPYPDDLPDSDFDKLEEHVKEIRKPYKIAFFLDESIKKAIQTEAGVTEEDLERMFGPELEEDLCEEDDAESYEEKTKDAVDDLNQPFQKKAMDSLYWEEDDYFYYDEDDEDDT